MRRSHFSIWLCSGLALAACGCAVAPPEPTRTGTYPPPGGAALVRYPAGGCEGELEIEVFDRAAARWQPHPEHPRLARDACVWEPTGVLLNELRLRCADPAGVRAPSAWVVGAVLAGSAGACEPTALQ